MAQISEPDLRKLHMSLRNYTETSGQRRTRAGVAWPQPFHSTAWMEGSTAATPSSAAPRIILLGGACRNLPHCAAGTWHDHEKSQEDFLQMQSIRNVYYEQNQARHSEQGKNMIRRFLGSDSGALELLNQVLGAARTTAQEKLLLQLLSGEEIPSLTGTTKSSLPGFPLHTENAPGTRTAYDHPATTYSFGSPFFNDPMLLNQVFDPQFLQLLTRDVHPSSKTPSITPHPGLDPEDNLNASMVPEDPDTTSSPRALYFDDAILIPATPDSEYGTNTLNEPYSGHGIVL